MQKRQGVRAFVDSWLTICTCCRRGCLHTDDVSDLDGRRPTVPTVGTSQQKDVPVDGASDGEPGETPIKAVPRVLASPPAQRLPMRTDAVVG